jgi:hypothetical protein
MLYELYNVISVQKPAFPSTGSLDCVSCVLVVHVLYILQYYVWCIWAAVELPQTDLSQVCSANRAVHNGDLKDKTQPFMVRGDINSQHL